MTLAALDAGRRLALANKESIIAGAPVVPAVPHARPGPRSSRSTPSTAPSTSACGPATRSDVARLLLTASGGPFRGRSGDELAAVGVADALAHPTWSMGPKITVDSSTLMNKGLEVIEAHELFGIPYDAIDVVVHPQSIVHSMVEFVDGAAVAQLSHARHAAAHRLRARLPASASPVALRAPSTGPSCRPSSSSSPTGSPFPCLDLAYRAGRAGDLAPAWLNAANEVAVAAFLAGRIAWTAIAEVVEGTLDRYEAPARPGRPAVAGRTVEDVLDADAAARRVAELSSPDGSGGVSTIDTPADARPDRADARDRVPGRPGEVAAAAGRRARRRHRRDRGAGRGRRATSTC